MLTAGIDMGAKTIKIVLLRDREIIAKTIGLAGLNARGSAEKLFTEILKNNNIQKSDIHNITVTGTGRKEIDFSTDEITEITAGARGSAFINSATRTVIDVGAEEGRGIRCDNTGRVTDFVTNEKCAAGAGAFTEAMARALEVSIEELGTLSLKSTKSIPMNAQCAVFAESEVVTLVHAKTSKEDIARAIMDAISSRIASMVSRVGVEREVLLIGGVAKNVGFVESLQRTLGIEVQVPDEPEYVCALGAALVGIK
jgi:benzoyl-CoA reductase subunit D